MDFVEQELLKKKINFEKSAKEISALDRWMTLVFLMSCNLLKLFATKGQEQDACGFHPHSSY